MNYMNVISSIFVTLAISSIIILGVYTIKHAPYNELVYLQSNQNVIEDHFHLDGVRESNTNELTQFVLVIDTSGYLGTYIDLPSRITLIREFTSYSWGESGTLQKQDIQLESNTSVQGLSLTTLNFDGVGNFSLYADNLVSYAVINQIDLTSFLDNYHRWNADSSKLYPHDAEILRDILSGLVMFSLIPIALLFRYQQSSSSEYYDII